MTEPTSPEYFAQMLRAHATQTSLETGAAPRELLAEILRALAKNLPGQLSALFSGERFAEGAAALARFSDESHVAAAIVALSEEEAAMLAQQMLRFWSAVHEIALHAPSSG